MRKGVEREGLRSVRTEVMGTTSRVVGVFNGFVVAAPGISTQADRDIPSAKRNERKKKRGVSWWKGKDRGQGKTNEEYCCCAVDMVYV